MDAVRGTGTGVRYDVCIVGLKCWGFVSRAESPRYIGGIEADLVTLARVLALAGKNVALVVYDEGQPAVSELDGITVYRSFSPDAGLPGLRFLFPRAAGLIRSLLRIRARYVIQMGAGVETGWTAIATKLAGGASRFLFFAAGDRDCIGGLPGIRHWRERAIYRLGLKLADCVVTQTEAQAELLRNDFGLSSEILRLPNALQEESGDGDTAPQSKEPAGEATARILWVGRIDRNKRPHWLLDLAAIYPEYRFDIVGEPNAADRYAEEFKTKAGTLPNVVLHGKVPRRNIARFYREADVLCCTSEFEGFPATFLEAWSFGLPTLSTVDPGGNISRHGVGAVVSSVEQLVRVLDKDRMRKELPDWSGNARRLYAEEFSPQACLARFTDVLDKVA